MHCNRNKKRYNIINKINNTGEFNKSFNIKKYLINKRNYNSSENSKLFGQTILSPKKENFNNKTQISNKFNSIMNQLNESLNFSELVKKSKPKLKKINIQARIPSNLLEDIKREKYYKKWHLNFKKTQDEEKPNIKSFEKKKTKNEKNKIEEYSLINKIIKNKRLLKPKEIEKISIRKIYEKNELAKYSLFLNNNIDYYIECRDQHRGFYDFDKQLRHMIKDNQIGIDYPGNLLKRNVLSYIKTLNPKNVTSKSTKNYAIPEKTYFHIPVELRNTSYHQLSMKEAYGYKSKMY